MFFEEYKTKKKIVKLPRDIKRYPEEEQKIKIIKEPAQAIRILKKLYDSKVTFAFDYETTGKKPFAEGHEIVCMSVCWNLQRAYAFPVFYDDNNFMTILKKLLQSEEHKKIAHNIKFEAIWTEQIFNVPLQGIYFDSMIMSHCLDNNTGVTGLKYQVKKRYGIDNYSALVDGYLKAPGKKPSSHAFNRIEECPIDDLLLYNGLDSLFNYRLYKDQLNEVDDFLMQGFNLFMEGTKAFIDIEQYGINVDIDYFKKQNEALEKKLEILHEKIMNTDEVKQWPEKDFNFNSSQQLAKLLFEILGYKIVKETDKGMPSTDEEALNKINKPFTNLILKYKKLLKIKNTYLGSFIRESHNGKIYPSFNLNRARSMRSSSSDPNFQNIPNRDKNAQRIIRSGIKPSAGNRLIEVDYSGAEVKMSACCHKDPAMIKYINDPDTDMHRDTAQDLLFDNDITKDERYLAKNNFVFPQFYGDYYVHCAKNLWGKISPERKQYLKDKGITSYRKFETHVNKVENTFWNDRFKKYNSWKIKTWNQYEKTGHMEMLTGFRLIHKMKKNEALNGPIQGPAFHWLLWSLCEVHKFIKENNYKSKIVGQIHDSMIFDMVPEEQDIILKETLYIMTEKIKKHWPWIIVPLEADIEVTPINGSWFEKEEYTI